MTTYQIVMNEEELEIFETIRSLRRRQKESRAGNEEEKRRLSQTVLIYGRAGDRVIGPWDIAAEDAILELATVGKELMITLTSDEWNAIPEPNPELEDDQDSLSGAQDEQDLADAVDEEEEPLSWDEVNKLLPSFITKVSFTVDCMKMSATDHKDLEDRFPDVDVRYLSTTTREEVPNKPTEIELPKGVRRAIFELDEVDEKDDLAVAERIKKEFPWAETRTRPTVLTPQEDFVGIPPLTSIPSTNSNFQTVEHSSGLPTPTRIPAKSNSAALRAPSSTEPRSPNAEANQLAIRHFINFKKILNGTPGNDDLDYIIQLYRNGKGWKDLSNEKKEAIAHARCIQAQYGQFVAQDKKCSNCRNHGNMCRVYIADLQPLANVNLGHGCQYCRISNNNCDVKTPNAATTQSTFGMRSAPVFPMTTSSISYEAKSDQGRIEAHTDLTTDPQALKRKPSVKDQTTQDPKKLHVEGVSENDNDMPTDDVEYDLPNSSLIFYPPQSIVYTIAKKTGLEMARLNVVEQEHNIWLDQKVIRPRSHNYKVEEYYSIIVDLCIIGFHTKDTDLQEAALLRFQKTTVEYTTSATWPPLKVVMKAFDHLPQDSALRRWIEITHSFLWNTGMYAPYEKFKMETNSSSDDARAAFMFGLANGRCRHTEGGEIAVLEAWCEVHNHRKGGIEEQKCKAERDKSSRCPLDRLIQKKEEEELKNAKRLIRTSSSTSRFAPRSGSPDQAIQTSRKLSSSQEGVSRGRRGKRGGNAIGM